MQKRKRREKDDKDDVDTVSLCSFDFKVRKLAKQHGFCKGRFGTADLSKNTNQEVLLFKLLPEVSPSTKCFKTTSKSHYNIKKEKKSPSLPYLSAKSKPFCTRILDEITCLWQKSKPFNLELEEFNRRKSFH